MESNELTHKSQTGKWNPWPFFGAILAASLLTACQCNSLTSSDPEDVTLGFETSYMEVREGENSKVTSTLSLSQPLDDPLTIEVIAVSVTAQAPDDYTVPISDGVLIFTPGESESVLEIEIVDDTNAEATETFAILLRGKFPDEIKLDKDSLTIAILDNDMPQISLESLPPVPEDVGKAVLTVRLSQTLEKDLPLYVSTIDGMAQSPDDYTALAPGSKVVIRAGDEMAEVEIPIIDDPLLEDDEDFLVKIGFVENVSLSTDLVIAEASTTVIIEDNDIIKVGFTETIVSVDESEKRVLLTVTLSKPRSESLTLIVTTADGTAQSPTDYTALPSGTTVTIRERETEATVEIYIIDDKVLETSEHFTVSLISRESSLPDDVRLRNTPATIIINDDESVVAGFTDLNFHVDEGADEVALTVSLSRPLDEVVTLGVWVWTADDTAEPPADYTAPELNKTITIPIGETTTIFKIPIIDDTIGEGSENFTVMIREIEPIPPALRLQRDVTTVTINDNDIITVGFESSEVNIVEGRRRSLFAVNLSGGTLKEALALALIPADGTASMPMDYLPPRAPPSGESKSEWTTTLVIPPGDSNGAVLLFIQDDRYIEDTEYFTVTLESEAGRLPEGVVYGNKSLTVTIIDNEPVRLGFTASTFRLGEGDMRAVLPVKFLEVVRVVRAPIVFDVTYTGGTATIPDDYDTPPESLEVAIPIGFNPVGLLEIPIREDKIIENEEYFTVTLIPRNRRLISDSITLEPLTATVVIVDNDTTAGFDSSMVTVQENIGTLRLAVNLSGMMTGENLELVANTSPGTALASEDYLPLSRAPVTILAGEMSAMVEINIVDTEFIEGREYFSARLEPVGTSLPEGLEFGNQSIAITVEDSGTIGFNHSALKAPENSGRVRLTVRLSGGILRENLELAATTIDDTARALEDYVPLSVASVTVLAGDTSAMMEIDIVNTALIEGDEHFSVRLDLKEPTLPPGVYFENKTTRITIEDTATVGFTSSSIEIGELEARGELKVEVKFSGEGTLANDLRFNLTASNGTALANLDYFPFDRNPVIIRAGQTGVEIPIEVFNDDTPEPDESFTLNISLLAPLPPHMSLDLTTFSITILNDD